MKLSEEQYQRNDGALCFIYQTWCKENGLPQMSADELLVEETIVKTQEQRNFIESFIVIWDYTMDLEVQEKDTFIKDHFTITHIGD